MNAETTLTAGQIVKLTAIVTGEPAKRAATKDAALRRFDAALRERVGDEIAHDTLPLILGAPGFETATGAAHGALDAADAEAEAADLAEGEAALDAMTFSPADAEEQARGELEAAEISDDKMNKWAELEAARKPVGATTLAPGGFATAEPRTVKAAPSAPVDGDPKFPREGSKNAQMLDFVRRPEGATEAEICSAIGWKACRATLGRVCSKAGLPLRAEKDAETGRHRYFVG